MPSNAGCGPTRSTWFQPICGSVGASSMSVVRPVIAPSVGDPLAQGLGEAPFVEPLHRGPRRPDSWDHDRVGRSEPIRVAHERDTGTDDRQSLLDAHEVPRTMVDDGDSRVVIQRRHPDAPFVLATPVRLGSGSHARRRAIARALKAASARWWSLRPVPRTWSVVPDVRANDSRACSTSWSGNSPANSPRNGRSMTA